MNFKSFASQVAVPNKKIYLCTFQVNSDCCSYPLYFDKILTCYFLYFSPSPRKLLLLLLLEVAANARRAAALKLAVRSAGQSRWSCMARSLGKKHYGVFYFTSVLPYRFFSFDSPNIVLSNVSPDWKLGLLKFTIWQKIGDIQPQNISEQPCFLYLSYFRFIFFQFMFAQIFFSKQQICATTMRHFEI